MIAEVFSNLADSVILSGSLETGLWLLGPEGPRATGMLQPGKPPHPLPPHQRAVDNGTNSRVPRTPSPAPGEPLPGPVRGCEAPCPGPSAETTGVTQRGDAALCSQRAAGPNAPLRPRWGRRGAAVPVGGLASSPSPPARPGPVRPAALTPAAPRRGLPGAAPSPQPSFLRRQKPDTGTAPRSPCAERRLCPAAPGAARPCRGPDRRPARSCPPAPCHVCRGAGLHACSPSGSSSSTPKCPAWAGPRRPAAPRSPTAGKVSGGGRDGTGQEAAGSGSRRGCGTSRSSTAAPGRCSGERGGSRAVSAPGAARVPSQRCRDARLRTGAQRSGCAFCGSWAEFGCVEMKVLLIPACCRSSPFTGSSQNAGIVLCY